MPSQFMQLLRPYIDKTIRQAHQIYPGILRITRGEKLWFEDPARRVQFEFGDFRIEAEATQTQLLLEVDSGSIDINNLVKYWYILDRHNTHPGVRAKKVILVHIYQQCETNEERLGQNYFSRVQLWEYLYPVIQQGLNGRFEATKYPVRTFGKDCSIERHDEESLSQAIEALRRAITFLV